MISTASSIGLLSLLPAALCAATTGTFDVITFNVAGLPAFLNGNDVPGDKTENTARIGQLFAQYDTDIIHVQEDFNFHATLYANDDHPYRTPTSGGVPFGDGMNTLSNFDWIDFERIKWDECSELASLRARDNESIAYVFVSAGNASGADCLTPKGFTFMRAKVSEGVWVDLYNLHADAG